MPLLAEVEARAVSINLRACAILRFMQLQTSAYIPGSSIVHACDARVKVMLLFGYTVTLFWADTWLGQGLFAALCLASILLARIPLVRLLAMGIPVYVLAAFTVVFASINQQVGFELGVFYGIRMILLVLASLVVVFTTTSSQLTDALRSFLRPLRALKVPVDDFAMVACMALRFIPVMAQELCAVHDAQWSRCAPFTGGSLVRRLSAWSSVFIPLFVGMFRRADKLSVAMDARCYGLSGKRTALREPRMKAADAVCLVCGLAFMAVVAAFL